MKTASVVLACCLVALAAAAGSSAVSGGDPNEGRATFAKLRCNTCHAVYGEPRGAKPVPHPLPDLSRETPEAVAQLIVSRAELDPHNLFDEQVMSISVSSMTRPQLADVVAYLRVKR